jgi:hypothetical protein
MSGWASSELQPGLEIFRAERGFQLWAHTVSHSQTLLRSPKGIPDGRGRTFDTRVDVLFEAVTAMKIRAGYDGLVIRVATPAEAIAIRAGWPGAYVADRGVFLLDSGGETDYVIAAIVSWHEDTLGLEEPSFFALDDPDGPPRARTPLFGLDGGLGGNVATAQQLIQALLDEPPVPDRDRYRYVYLVMVRSGTYADDTAPAGAFVTKDEAEEALGRARDRVVAAGWRSDRVWIKAVPIAVRPGTS